ncbi:MAG: hypothetical protein U1A53_13225 [Prosthecobacter sp.]|nr:hypothetical protein [Prosthecobacter sp.]MDZ4403629.1 hypothetical protein [Prosthecobacter sp.]
MIIQGGFHELAFLGLELEDAFLDGATDGQAVGVDDLLLADAVRAVDGLGFDGGIPPRVGQDDVVGGCQIDAITTGFEG